MDGIEELALKMKGCVVSYVTSSSARYEDMWNIIDGQRNTYWCTTGSYPQAFIISFPDAIAVSSVKVRSYSVQLISLEKSTTDTPQLFEVLGQKELELTDHVHQITTLHSATFTARHLRFTIHSGYDHICAMYKVEVQGSFNGSDTTRGPTPAHDVKGLIRKQSSLSVRKESPMWVEEEEDDREEVSSPLETISHITKCSSHDSSEEDQ